MARAMDVVLALLLGIVVTSRGAQARPLQATEQELREERLSILRKIIEDLKELIVSARTQLCGEREREREVVCCARVDLCVCVCVCV